MKKLLLILISVCIILILSACGKEKEEVAIPQIIDVKLSVTPEKANVNEPIKFEARVTYGKEEVTDADEVKFEIWRAHDEKHEKFIVEHDKNGVYSLEKSFAKEGTYYIFSHVTARNMHSMPKKEFVIGKPSKPEEDSKSAEMSSSDDEQSDDDEHGDH